MVASERIGNFTQILGRESCKTVFDKNIAEKNKITKYQKGIPSLYNNIIMKKLLTKSKNRLFVATLVVLALSFTSCSEEDSKQIITAETKAGVSAVAENGDSIVMVDLGLPSGTKWADRNVGASLPEAYGDYFAFGETTPKEEYTWETYTLCKEEECQTETDTIAQYKNISGSEYDVATVNWGRKYRMPTDAQAQELITYCEWVWITKDNVYGYLIKGQNGNSIFLPAAGIKRGNELWREGTYATYRCGTFNFICNGGCCLCLSNLGNIKSWNVAYVSSRMVGGCVRPVSQ